MQTTTRTKTLKEATDFIYEYEKSPGVAVEGSRVEYQPNKLTNLFKYDYRPYKVTVWWVESGCNR